MSTKKQRVLSMVKDWIGEMPKCVASQHHVNRIAGHYGADMEKALDSMTHDQLATVLCLIVAQNAKAHQDQRTWFKKHREATRQPAAVIPLKLVK